MNNLTYKDLKTYLSINLNSECKQNSLSWFTFQKEQEFKRYQVMCTLKTDNVCCTVFREITKTIVA